MARSVLAALPILLFALLPALSTVLLFSGPVYATTAKPAVPAQENAQEISAAALEAFFDVELPAILAENHIPGAAVAVVYNGDPIYLQGYGYAHVEPEIPVDAERTLFRTGSAGKLFTWTAVMQLVEQDRLDLDADVNDYLDFTIPEAFGAPITLQHLMTHTPGFENIGEDLFHLSAEEIMPLRDYLMVRMPERVYPPGQVGAYSNYGTALAGYIVERVTGEPLAAYVENHIFAPLGMARSTLRQPLAADLANDLARGYGYVDGAYVPGEFIYVSPYPAGASSATVADMAAFMRAYLQEGGFGAVQLLQPETVAQMHTRHYTADARLHGMTLGWMERQLNARRILYHKGSIVSFHTGLYLLPEENLGLYVAYNGVNAALAPDPLFYAFLDHFFPAPASPEGTAPTDAGAAERVAGYAGEYHPAVADYNSAGKLLRILETGQVASTPTGELSFSGMGETAHYTEVEPGVYRENERGQLLIFQTDSEGTTWLLRDGEPHFVYFQPPWYALSSVTALTIVGGLLLFVGSGLVWLVVRGIRAWRRRRRQAPATDENSPVAGTTMRSGWRVWIVRGPALLFGLLLVFYLQTILGILGQMHPAYGVPMIMFGTPPGEELLNVLPWLLALAAVAMLAGLVYIWRDGMRGEGMQRDGMRREGAHLPRPAWNVWQRLHYTLLTVWAVALLVVFAYWNLWTLPV